MEVEQIVRLVPAAAALLPGQAPGLTFQSLPPRLRIDQPLLFCDSRSSVLLMNIFSLRQFSEQILCQEGSG